jgi:hypothetical protein
MVGLAGLIASTLILAHPGSDIEQEVAARSKNLEGSRVGISHCTAKLKARGIERQAIERRAEILRAERVKRGFPTGMRACMKK